MQLINDRIAAVGLFIVALTAWGSNVFGSQAYMMNCVGLAALAFITKDKILTVFGCYCAVWFAYIQIAESVKWMPADSMVQAVDTLTLIMAGYALYTIIKFGRASKIFWMNTVCVLSIGLSCIGILQYFKVGAATATLACTNFLAAFLAISTIFFYRGFSLRFKKIWKLKIPYSPVGWWMFLPLIIGALFLAHTSTAILALTVGTGFFLWRLRGAIIGIIPGIFYTVFIDHHSMHNARFDFWLDAWNKLSNHWYTLLFGTGPSILWRTDNMLHSEPVYLLWNFGIIGLLLAGAYIIRTFSVVRWPYYRVPDKYLFSALIVIIIDSLGNHLFHITSTAYLTVVICALNDRKILGT
jgi:hypothetical protein